MKKLSLLLLIMISSFSLLKAEPASFQGSTMYLKEGVIDLRETVYNKGTNTKKTSEVIYSLKKGDIFVDIDNIAKKVDYVGEDSDGNYVIETSKPQIHEVIDGLHIPDQTINPNIDNIIPGSVADGVTIDNTKKGSNFSMSISLDLGKLLNAKKMSNEMKERWANKKFIDEFAGLLEDEEGGTKEEKKREIEKKLETEKSLTLFGNLTMENVGVSVGARLPSISWEQRSKKVWFVRVYWWVPVKHKGYINYSYGFDKKLTVGLKGTAGVSAEMKYPIYAINIPAGVASATMGVYIKASANGSLSLEASFTDEEKVRCGASGDVDFAWTLFKIEGFRSWKNVYDKKKYFEFKGIMEAEVKLGPAAGFELEALGFTLADIEVFLGLYASLECTVGAKLQLEPSKSFSIGGEGKFETGIFAEAGGELLEGMLSFTLFNWKYALYSKTLYEF